MNSLHTSKAGLSMCFMTPYQTVKGQNAGPGVRAKTVSGGSCRHNCLLLVNTEAFVQVFMAFCHFFPERFLLS